MASNRIKNSFENLFYDFMQMRIFIVLAINFWLKSVLAEVVLNGSHSQGNIHFQDKITIFQDKECNI